MGCSSIHCETGAAPSGSGCANLSFAHGRRGHEVSNYPQAPEIHDMLAYIDTNAQLFFAYTDRFWPKLKRNLLLLFAVIAGEMPPTNTMSRKATPIGELKSPFIENDISVNIIQKHDTARVQARRHFNENARGQTDLTHTYPLSRYRQGSRGYLQSSRERRMGGARRCATCPESARGRHRTPNCSYRHLLCRRVVSLVSMLFKYHCRRHY